MYLEELKGHIEKVFATKAPTFYDDVFGFSKGAFPDIVHELISKFNSSYFLKEKYYGFKEVNNIIPESNPTNYDWRFDDKTVQKITTFIKSRKYNRVALFGTPSLFSPL